MSKVSLVGMTKPSSITGCNTAEQLVAYAARVSNPQNQNNTKTAPKLLKYLIREGHWSPFEIVHITMEIVTTRDIARQILRHRSFSFQEFSQRYAEVQEDFEVREARLQDPKNRQNSIELDTEDFGKGGNQTPQERLYEDWWMRQRSVINEAKKVFISLYAFTLISDTPPDC